MHILINVSLDAGGKALPREGLHWGVIAINYYFSCRNKFLNDPATGEPLASEAICWLQSRRALEYMYPRGSTIDLGHMLHLRTALRRVILVDADGVNPKLSVLGKGAKFA